MFSIFPPAYFHLEVTSPCQQLITVYYSRDTCHSCHCDTTYIVYLFSLTRDGWLKYFGSVTRILAHRPESELLPIITCCVRFTSESTDARPHWRGYWSCALFNAHRHYRSPPLQQESPLIRFGADAKLYHLGLARDSSLCRIQLE